VNIILFDFFGMLYNMITGNKSRSENINVLTARDYYDRLHMVGLSLFEWENLPESCNARFLEMTLFSEGRAIFVNDETLGFLTLRVTPNGEINHYNEYTSYTAFSNTYREKEFKRDECVFIRNNYLEKPTSHTVMLYASRLSELQRTIDVNINAQKTPVFIRCDEKDRTTLENIYKQFEGNRPVILGGKNVNLDGIKVFKTDAPYVADKLQIQKHETMNEVLTFFGIQNANTQKRERLITQEVEANDEQVSVMAEAMLITRQEACEQINKKFGLNISVRMRNFNETKEVEDDGELHSGAADNS
jgi:hypothetical protein